MRNYESVRLPVQLADRTPVRVRVDEIVRQAERGGAGGLRCVVQAGRVAMLLAMGFRAMRRNRGTSAAIPPQLPTDAHRALTI